MTRRIALSALVLACTLLPALSAAADKPLPPSVVVEEGPFGSAVVMDGVLAPLGAIEIKIEPKRYGGPFEIVEAARAGPVEPGQTLVKFDRQPIERQLEAGAVDLELARTRFEQTEINVSSKVDDLRHDLEEARRAWRTAREKLDRFERVERQLRVDEAKQSMAWGRDNLSNQQEELEQLEKMYKEDDLTEETEEIVLRRARRAFERSKRSYEFRELRHKWFLEETLPRDHDALRLALRKREIRLEKTTKSLESEKREAELERRKAAQGLAEQERKYAELRADRDLLVVRAPNTGGYALPGEFRGGKWSGLGEDGVRWKAGDTTRSGTVLFTVFEPTRLGVRATVDQKHLADIRPGRPCSVTSSAVPEKSFPAEVESVSDYAEGSKYGVRIALRAGDPWLRAGQKVKAIAMGASARIGLSIPVRCVVGKGTKAHVLLVGEGGVEKRAVVLGEKIGDRIGIKQGLEAGQRVVLNPPKVGLGAADEEKAEDEEKAGPVREVEEDAAEGGSGKEPDDSGAPEEVTPEEALKASLIGTWRGKVMGPEPFPPDGFDGSLVLELGDDGEIGGVFVLAGTEVAFDSVEFDFETGSFSFEANSDTGTVTGQGRVEDDELTGTWATTAMGGLEGTFRFEREDDA